MINEFKNNKLDTNYLFLSNNFKNISNDFWIYKFTTQNKSYKYSLIDELKQNLSNVKSVVYLKGKTFYALFKKNGQTDIEIEEQIKSLIKTQPEDILFNLVTNIADKEEINRRHLAQLLLNSLATTSTYSSNISNITGKLYWIVDSSQKKFDKKPITWQYIALKIELDYHLHLKLDVSTFSNILMRKHLNFKNRKKSFKDYIQYEILSDNIRSMRRLNSPDYSKETDNTYILAQVESQKNNVPFLSFSDWNSFIKSKSGVLYLFLKEVKEHLRNYLTIEFKTLPFSEKKVKFNKEISERVKTKIQNFYQNNLIVLNIADSLKNDEKANELLKNTEILLTDLDRNYKASNVKTGDLNKDALNIRIIRNKSYYESENIPDEYNNNPQYLTHHITTDDFNVDLFKIKKEERHKILSSPAIDVILKESFIKNDIKSRKISIINWTFGDWVFMTKKEIKVGDEYQSNFYALKVSNDGGISIESCKKDEMFKTNKYEQYKTIFEQYGKYNGREFLKYLIVSNDNDINLIYDTPLFTIQKIDKIGKTLELENQDNELNKKQLQELLKNFKVLHPQYDDNIKFKETCKNIDSYRNELSKKELNQIFHNNGLSNRTKLKKDFCKYYYENSERVLGYEDVLHHFFKSKDDIEELFASSTNIYYQINGNSEAYYFVGTVPKQIQTSFQKATNIRKVKAVRNLNRKQSKLVFDKLLETMNVDFVKQGGLTVVPFPFKYLREMIKIINQG